MGYLDDEEILGAAPLRVFLDIDPGFGQMWQELGLAEPFAGHDRYVTIGGADRRARLHDPDLRARVDHDQAAGRARRVAGVAAGDGPAAPSPASRAGAARSGRSSTAAGRYGLRVHEFRRFLELPARTGADFEVALDIDEADADDLRPARRGTAGRWPIRARPRATRGATATTSGARARS